MTYYIVPICLLASIVLLVVGIRQNNARALYMMQGCWVIVLIIAAFFLFEAWQYRDDGKGMNLLNIFLVVWPATLVIVILAAVGLFKLKGRQDEDTRRLRLSAVVITGLMVLISVSSLMLG